MRSTSLFKTLALRRDEISDWLHERAPETFEKQAHLDGHTAEQAYWNHGYQAALGDVMELIASRESSNAGRPTH